MTEDNVVAKAAEFTRLTERERSVIGPVNELLADYSRLPTLDAFELLQDTITRVRAELDRIHTAQTALVGEWFEGDSEVEAKRVFLREVIDGLGIGDVALVERLAGKMTAEDEQEEEAFAELRNRTLTYILQGMGTTAGKRRLAELSGLLGDRQIKLGGLGAEFGASTATEEDSEKGLKQETREPQTDQELLEDQDGDLLKFINESAARLGTRTPNADRDEIGDIKIFLERHKKLFPVYFGINSEEALEMFTSPMFTAMHHEVGHAVNYLKGTGGGGNKYKDDTDGDLSLLTDEEEVYNISLDRFSDKVMSEELELPVRVAHKSFMALMAGTEEFDEREMHRSLTKWQGLTGQRGGGINLIRTLQVQIDEIAPTAGGFHGQVGDRGREVGELLEMVEHDPEEVTEPQRFADALAWSIDQLEHKVNNRLEIIQRSARPIIKTDGEELQALRDRLDEVQGLHRRYVAYILSQDLHLWVPGGLLARDQANAAWQRLAAGTGGIRIEGIGREDTVDSDARFRNEMMSNMARLLSRDKGRGLVNSLLNEPGALTLSTPDPVQVERVGRALGVEGEELQEQLINMFGGQAGPVRQEDSTAVDGEDGLERGVGSPSTMSLMTGLTDSHGLSVDERGRVIFSPNYIEMGHEMIHALHNIRGASLLGKQRDNYGAGSAWDNMSEHSVIAGTPEMEGLLGDDNVTENMLREEHQLGERYGHSNTKALVHAIRNKIKTIVDDPAWNSRGGILRFKRTAKTPGGIVALRTALTHGVQAADWPAIFRNARTKSGRGKTKKFLMRIDDTTQQLYGLISRFGGLVGRRLELGSLQDLLVELERFHGGL